jgi:hypothetical protein
MNGGVILIVGLVLCFLGVGSIHLEVLAAGFGLGWLVSELFGTSPETAIVMGAAGAVLAWVLAALVFRAASFFVGAVVGGLVGAKLAVLLEPHDDRNALLATVVILAAAAVSGLLAHRFRNRFLLVLTAFGGAGLVLNGLGRLAPDELGFLRRPDDAWERGLALACWFGLAIAGWVVQRRLFPRALHIDRRRR